MTCTLITITSDSYTIQIPMPTWNNVDGKIDNSVDVLNFYEDEDFFNAYRGLNTEPVILRGRMLISDITDEAMITNIWGIMDNDEEVDITGIGDCIDDRYIIINYRLDAVEDVYHVFDYTILLERVVND